MWYSSVLVVPRSPETCFLWGFQEIWALQGRFLGGACPLLVTFVLATAIHQGASQKAILSTIDFGLNVISNELRQYPLERTQHHILKHHID